LLAYVFFHRPQAGADVRSYEDGLRRFHAAVASARPDGFVSSSTYRAGDRYSDWYLVETSAALDVLNVAAVTGAASPLHDAVARMSADGAGKLLRLVAGTVVADANYEIRFSKPRGMSYAELYASLERWTQRPGVSLWRRMMVLGPPPEFCMLAPSEQRLPAELSPEVFGRKPI
jgi:hypothetical protein